MAFEVANPGVVEEALRSDPSGGHRVHWDDCHAALAQAAQRRRP